MQRQVGSTTNDKLEPYIAPEDARTRAVECAPNLTILKGELLGPTAPSGQYVKAVDTVQVAEVIASRSFKTDADGNVFYGSGADMQMTGTCSNPHPH